MQGIVTKVEAAPSGKSGAVATVRLSDFRNLKVTLLLLDLKPHLLPKKTNPKPKQDASVVDRFSRPSPSKRKKLPVKLPEGVPTYGPELQAFLATLRATTDSSTYPPGTRLWASFSGNVRWPCLAWSVRLCKLRDLGAVAISYRPGHILVLWYGEHSLTWVRPEQCDPSPADESVQLRSARAWSRSHNKLGLLDLAIEEMEEGHGNDPDTEARRMTDLYDAYLRRRMDDSCCYICRDPGPVLQCISCERQYHTLCTQIPAVALEAFPEGRWQCPCCAQVQSVLRPVPADSPEGDAEGRGEEQVERMGLTPDWIIAAAAFQVFQLPRPSADRPYIRGLLDPCTNSKVAPNIPAERLYDKQDNGLKLENSWAGQYVLLNPDFSAQVQWRFVNRAIDEVENDSVPAVILIVRNSTDTAYYQRLRPYPRVHLRRTSARFKDYSKSPIGFGIAVFCVAKHSCTELFGRFIDAFEPMGEPNLPIDKLFLASPACAALLERLRKFAAEHHRDHWVQCSECGKWRILDFSAASQVSEEADWRCAMLRPPYSSCDTLPTTREMMGGKYAARGLEDVGATWGGYAVAQGQQGGAPEVQAHPMQVGYTSLTTAPSPPPPSMVPFIPPESDHMHQSELRPSSHVPGNSLCSASSGVVLSRSDSIEPAALQAAVDTLPLNSIIDSIIAQGEETSDECEVVTALEMARQARIAANRAYFQQLGLNSAGCGGEGPNAAPLAYDDPAVMAAAREISKRVALETCRQQEEEARKRYAAVSRRCRQEAARLLAALQEVRNTEAVAKKAWEAAQSAAAELTAELSHRTV